MDLNKKSSKKIKKTDIGITVVIIIGILAVVNFFSYQIFYRWDLTQGKIYSISKASKKTVSELDDIVNIKAYFSDNLPSQFITLRQEVADIMDEYQALSNGKIKVEFIDPADDEDIQRELYIIGIPQLTFEVYEKDKIQLVNGYMGIAISFGDKIEAIPAVKRDTRDLEYQITTAIKKVTSEEIATIGFLTSHGTAGLEGDMSAAYKELQELYTVRQIEFTAEVAEVPADIDTLIIVGPKEEFNEEQLKAINFFMMRGGFLMILLDGVIVERGLLANKNNTGLDSLLEKYGVKVNQNLVADVRNGMASFTQGFVTFSTSYPFWPKITNEGFNKENSAVANLENVILPWTSTIDIMEEKFGEESAITNLVFTTDKAWQVKDNFNISPQSLPVSQGEQKQYNLAVAVSGKFNNAYPDENEETNSSFSSRLIVVGDSDFIHDGFLRNTPDNLTFFQNLVDSLSFDEDLISIRSKGASSRPIKEGLSDGTRVVIRYLNVFALTVIVILFGMVRYYLRRRSRFVDDL
jgi:gliding-associated putative ABC transporter substrate-binding component GldG